MIVERLQQALLHVEELPPEAQIDLAEQIELWMTPEEDWRSLLGAVKLPDSFDEIDEVLRARHEVSPSPPVEDM